MSPLPSLLALDFPPDVEPGYCLMSCTISPLVASSGSVMVAGVVRRFRARVSWSITASMSYGSKKNKEASITDRAEYWDVIHTQLCTAWNRAWSPRGARGQTLLTSAPVLK